MRANVKSSKHRPAYINLPKRVRKTTRLLLNFLVLLFIVTTAATVTWYWVSGIRLLNVTDSVLPAITATTL